jgi:predicted enzyme involved in methoxymalonyl-ACP biosynthesis
MDAIDSARFLPLMAQGNIDDTVVSQCLKINSLQPRLDLSNTKITDASSKYIKLQTSAINVILDNTQITDKGLLELANMHEVGTLSLRCTNITSAGLAVLTSMPNIIALHLDYSEIDPRCIQYIQPLNGLNYLSIRNCKIPITALRPLLSLPLFRYLDVSEEVTPL